MISLSLVNEDLYQNWEEEIEKLEIQYKNTHLLVLVSKTDSEQKSEFMIEWMKQRAIDNNHYEKAYQITLEKILLKSKTLDFKHYFHPI